MYPEDCGNFFDCTDLKNLTIEQAFKMLFKPDANGCPALNILGTVDTGGVPVVVTRTPNLIEDAISVGVQALPITTVSYSVLFDGAGGKLNGITVPDKYQVNYGNGFDVITGALSYNRPPVGRVLISTLT
jgi:hypothetical protein